MEFIALSIVCVLFVAYIVFLIIDDGRR